MCSWGCGHLDHMTVMLWAWPLLCLLRHPGITSGLMKGALSVAASAYKALFTGQGPTQVSSTLNSAISYFTF